MFSKVSGYISSLDYTAQTHSKIPVDFIRQVVEEHYNFGSSSTGINTLDATFSFSFKERINKKILPRIYSFLFHKTTQTDVIKKIEKELKKHNYKNIYSNHEKGRITFRHLPEEQIKIRSKLKNFT